MIYNKFLLLKFLGSIGLTGLSEISFSTMAWRLGIRGEKIEEEKMEMKMSYGKKREIRGFCFYNLVIKL
jgi:hypothetical protein